MRHDTTGDHLQLLVLKAMPAEVLQLVHNFLLGRHLGQRNHEGVGTTRILLEWDMERL